MKRSDMVEIIMKVKKKSPRNPMPVANIITVCRILFSLIMIFMPVPSAWFFVFYLAAGFTDMIDGTVARKMGTSSAFGAKLDTLADTIFIFSASFKLLPNMQIPIFIWIWIGLIAVIKVINIISGLIVQKQFVSVHSIANKITGGLLFVLPLTLSLIELKYSAVVVCIAATFAAVQEGHFIRTEYVKAR